MAHLTASAAADKPKGRAAQKPEKPYEGFPLFPHATGRWAKKIRGSFHYFGPPDDPDGALAKYLEAGATDAVRLVDHAHPPNYAQDDQAWSLACELIQLGREAVVKAWTGSAAVLGAESPSGLERVAARLEMARPIGFGGVKWPDLAAHVERLGEELVKALSGGSGDAREVAGRRPPAREVRPADGPGGEARPARRPERHRHATGLGAAPARARFQPRGASPLEGHFQFGHGREVAGLGLIVTGGAGARP